ncbi:MAG: transposase [Bryobacteraceae bacterium]
MLEALLEGKASADQIAELAKGRARRRIPELAASLAGHRMSEHHRRMIRYSLEHLGFLEKHLLALDEEILRQIDKAGFRPALDLIKTVPGIQQDSAVSVLAEVGPDINTFPSAGHLSSWAGLCPGNRQSAGKDKGGRTTRGNRWLRTTMTQCAWAASAKKNCYLKGARHRCRRPQSPGAGLSCALYGTALSRTWCRDSRRATETPLYPSSSPCSRTIRRQCRLPIGRLNGCFRNSPPILSGFPQSR